MPVFISYSHQDGAFVDQLALGLVRGRANVWLDRWELRVGDSLLDRIQEAIGSAEALVVVLTPASVQSSWCRRELNAGLMRELEEARVVVLPVLVEDCEIPVFLREKFYADFRGEFAVGLEQVLQALAPATSTTLGREGDEHLYVDYGIDWFTVDGRFLLRLTIIQTAQTNPYTVVTEVSIHANYVLTERYRQYDEAGLDWVGRGVIFRVLRQSPQFSELQVLIADDFPAVREMRAVDPRSGVGADITVTCRRFGSDTGADILVSVGALAGPVIDSVSQRGRPLTAEERARLAVLLGDPPRAAPAGGA